MNSFIYFTFDGRRVAEDIEPPTNEGVPYENFCSAIQKRKEESCMTSFNTRMTVFGTFQKQGMNGGEDAENQIRQQNKTNKTTSWIQLGSIVIAVLVFRIGLVVVISSNLFPRPLPPASKSFFL